MSAASAVELDALFRRESGRILAALVRRLGPAHVALAEDVVQDALVSATMAWRFGLPENPTAWLIEVAKNRAVDVLRRERRFDSSSEQTTEEAIGEALSPEADGENQLAMMFALCDEALSVETHVTLILRLLCGFSPAEIAHAFMVDVGVIDRRLHRGRARLREIGTIRDVHSAEAIAARQSSVEQALYLLFNEGYHGSDPESPVHPAMCADALRLAELLLAIAETHHASAHALAALFCFHAARLNTRLANDGAFVPLAEQDRTQWDRALLERGVVHLGSSASGAALSRWHLEAGIALEHTMAPSIEATNWEKICAYYDALMAVSPGPVVALNRGLAIAELHGLDAGRAVLLPLATDPKLARYSFYWAARADIERRSGQVKAADAFYRRALELATSTAERRTYEKRLASGRRDRLS